MGPSLFGKLLTVLTAAGPIWLVRAIDSMPTRGDRYPMQVISQSTLCDSVCESVFNSSNLSYKQIG